MTKGITPWDSTHQIGLVRHSLGLSDCSVGISRVEKCVEAGFEIPKMGHGLASSPYILTLL